MVSLCSLFSFQGTDLSIRELPVSSKNRRFVNTLLPSTKHKERFLSRLSQQKREGEDMYFDPLCQHLISKKDWNYFNTRRLATIVSDKAFRTCCRKFLKS